MAGGAHARQRPQPTCWARSASDHSPRRERVALPAGPRVQRSRKRTASYPLLQPTTTTVFAGRESASRMSFTHALRGQWVWRRFWKKLSAMALALHDGGFCAIMSIAQGVSRSGAAPAFRQRKSERTAIGHAQDLTLLST